MKTKWLEEKEKEYYIMKKELDSMFANPSFIATKAFHEQVEIEKAIAEISGYKQALADLFGGWNVGDEGYGLWCGKYLIPFKIVEFNISKNKITITTDNCEVIDLENLFKTQEEAEQELDRRKNG